MFFHQSLCIPDEEESRQLRADFERNCEQAADWLRNCDVLVSVTGAGFSADSGLAVYADVANIEAYQSRGLDYCDICQSYWMYEEPDLFYGFWGQCFNDYRSTQPHEGYEIIARWRDDKNAKQSCNKSGTKTVAEQFRDVIAEMEAAENEEEIQRCQGVVYPVTNSKGGPAGAFFAFTSNVDAHSFDVFEPFEVRECHGNIELWQCTSIICPSNIFRAPLNHQFVVDPKTMLAPEKKKDSRSQYTKSTIEVNDTLEDRKVELSVSSDKVTKDSVVEPAPDRKVALKEPAAALSVRDEQKINPQQLRTEMGISIAEVGDNGDSGRDCKRKRETETAHIGCTLGCQRRNPLQNMPFLDDQSTRNQNGWFCLNSHTDNWPRCGKCGSLARPAILMFGDFEWKDDSSQRRRWQRWKSTLFHLCQVQQSTHDNNDKSRLKIGILEVGCGMNVPTCRSESEGLLKRLLESGGDVKLIRINPDLPLTDSETVSRNMIPIMSRGLVALKQMDNFYRKKKTDHPDDETLNTKSTSTLTVETEKIDSSVGQPVVDPLVGTVLDPAVAPDSSLAKDPVVVESSGPAPDATTGQAADVIKSPSVLGPVVVEGSGPALAATTGQAADVIKSPAELGPVVVEGSGPAPDATTGQAADVIESPAVLGTADFPDIGEVIAPSNDTAVSAAVGPVGPFVACGASIPLPATVVTAPGSFVNVPPCSK